MKLLPLILAAILLAPGLHPCLEDTACRDASSVHTDVCQTAEDEHACCRLPADQAPPNEAPCEEGCLCYCCVSVIAPDLAAPLPFPPLETDRRNPWMATMHSHDFSHLIWHPPQAG